MLLGCLGVDLRSRRKESIFDVYMNGLSLEGLGERMEDTH
jgi:hypothetical protein